MKTLQVSHNSGESSGIRHVPNVEDKADVVHHLGDKGSGVEGVWLNVLLDVEASILLSTTHVCNHREREREKRGKLIVIGHLLSPAFLCFKAMLCVT